MGLAINSLCAITDSSVPADMIVENYCTASRAQEHSLQGASMDVEFDASLPKLKKHGRLHALRRISPLGLIKYERLLFEGDGTVNHQVITRYLTAEAESQRNSRHPGRDPRNYGFKYKGLKQLDGRDIFFDRRSRSAGVCSKEVWIDARTYLRCRNRAGEEPFHFLKKVAFNEYVIRDGISVPRQVLTSSNQAGRPAELTIDFSNFSVDSSKPVIAEDAQ
jgi:hypothetical protein